MLIQKLRAATFYHMLGKAEKTSPDWKMEETDAQNDAEKRDTMQPQM